MNRIEIETILNQACESIYQDEPALIKNETHERTLVGCIFCCIRKPFQKAGWDVDLEYNRQGDNGDSKHDLSGNMVPDVIVHTRESVSGPNLLAIEFKGYWNNTDRSKDEEKLRRLRSEFGYNFLYQIELGKNNWTITEVDPTPDAQDASI